MAGRFIVRFGFLRSVLFSLVASAAGLLLTLFPCLVVVIAGLAICSCGVFICQSATISHIAVNVTEGRSLATGLYYLSYYAGGAAGSWVAGVAFESWKWEGSVFSIIVFQMLAATIAIRFLQPRPVTQN